MAGDLTLAQAEAALGEPAARWEMRCYEIASRLVHARAVEGKAVYGHWRGPVHPAAPFTSVVVVRHGWINLPDGRICDPTRWVFEQVTAGPGLLSEIAARRQAAGRRRM